MEKSTGMILAHCRGRVRSILQCYCTADFYEFPEYFPTVDAYYDSDKRDRQHVLLWQGSESNRTDSRGEDQ